MADPTRSKNKAKGRTTPKKDATVATLRPRTFDHLKSSKRPLERRVPIVLNDEVLQEQGDAMIALGGLLDDEGTETSALDAARQRVEDAEIAVKAATEWILVRSVGRKAFEEIVQTHPPTDEELQEATDNGEPAPPYASEPFTIALIAASAVDPVISEEQAQEIYDDWNTPEILELFTACLAVNTQRRVMQLGE